MSNTTIRAVGIGWFRQEDYPAILGIFEDADQLPATWEKWFQSAQRLEQQLGANGFVVERAYIDANMFPAWCSARGLNVNAEARKLFASEAAARKYRNQS